MKHLLSGFAASPWPGAPLSTHCALWEGAYGLPAQPSPGTRQFDAAWVVRCAMDN